MKLIDTLLPGCFLLQPKKFEDQRGYFVKTYHEGLCAALGVNLDIREEFYSISYKNVIRGMHFQLPPYAHDKFVYCTRGAVKDVMLDLRRGENYGNVVTTELSGENGHILFIPKGVAHGFLALTDEALMIYKTSNVHVPESDGGIGWDGFGFNWGIDQPIISARDQQHIAFGEFVSPF